MLYHVALPDDWKLAQKAGVYTLQMFDEHHLIPCRDSDQLPKYINTNFWEKRGVVVLVITEKIIAEQIQHHSM